MKAVKITAENRVALGARYGIDDPENVFPIGDYIVAPFGTTDDEYYEGILTEVKLHELFTVGEPLENGYFAITPK